MSTTSRLSSRVVLVTGSSRGVGLAIATAFVHKGARVVLNYLHNKDIADTACAKLGNKTIAIQADVTVAESVQHLFAVAERHFGAPITVVVNNALAAFEFNGEERENLETISWASFDSQIRGAVQGALNTTQAALPRFKEPGNRGARIINIGSNLVQNPVVPYHDYTAAKGALLAFTRTAAKELGQYGVTVNMVAAGLLKVTDASAKTPQAVWDAVAAQTPLGRCCTPEDVAGAVFFFASDWASGITGQQLIVDGGLVMN